MNRSLALYLLLQAIKQQPVLPGRRTTGKSLFGPGNHRSLLCHARHGRQDHRAYEACNERFSNHGLSPARPVYMAFMSLGQFCVLESIPVPVELVPRTKYLMIMAGIEPVDNAINPGFDLRVFVIHVDRLAVDHVDVGSLSPVVVGIVCTSCLSDHEVT